jgi:hypothetical protein
MISHDIPIVFLSSQPFMDGKYNYCFSNEGWTSNSKEVSFNVHGIVYVPEHEMAQDVRLLILHLRQSLAKSSN